MAAQLLLHHSRIHTWSTASCISDPLLIDRHLVSNDLATDWHCLAYWQDVIGPDFDNKECSLYQCGPTASCWSNRNNWSASTPLAQKYPQHPTLDAFVPIWARCFCMQNPAVPAHVCLGGGESGPRLLEEPLSLCTPERDIFTMRDAQQSWNTVQIHRFSFSRLRTPSQYTCGICIPSCLGTTLLCASDGQHVSKVKWGVAIYILHSLTANS